MTSESQSDRGESGNTQNAHPMLVGWRRRHETAYKAVAPSSLSSKEEGEEKKQAGRAQFTRQRGQIHNNCTEFGDKSCKEPRTSQGLTGGDC